jgi:hypothetical protein
MRSQNMRPDQGIFRNCNAMSCCCPRKLHGLSKVADLDHNQRLRIPTQSATRIRWIPPCGIRSIPTPCISTSIVIYPYFSCTFVAYLQLHGIDDGRKLKIPICSEVLYPFRVHVDRSSLFLNASPSFSMILGPAPNILFRLIFSSPAAILPCNDGLTLR